jgi:phosphate transport system substrate-binding protein
MKYYKDMTRSPPMHWMRALAAMAVLTAVAPAAFGQPVTGAGATFPAPVYAEWAKAARAATGVDLTYSAVGSGEGQKRIVARAVDFGAADVPMDPAALARADLLQFPTVIGAVVVIVNLPRVREGELKLTGEALAAIYAGTVRKWNDPLLQALNPDLTLPNVSIAPVHRFDPSGTSFVFTSYLSAVSADWKSAYGAGTSVAWPAGPGARGNDGVASAVALTRGGIGYVESSFAIENHLNIARLRNRSGAFVKPVAASFNAAAAAADWAVADFAVNLVDTAGPANWPIVSTTFILLPKDPADAGRSAAVMRFFDWAYSNGGPIAERLGYIVLPAAIPDSVRESWRTQILSDGKPVFK